MFKNIFIQSGLSSKEATVYEFLITHGESKAGEIIQKTPLKRGLVYNALDDLLAKNLIKSKKKEKVTYFKSNHPSQLRDHILNKKQELKQAENTLEANMPQIVSTFNLISGQPGVRYYEGKEGIIKVLKDSLTSKTEIQTYADVYGMETYLGKANDKYVQKRKELGIKKRGIVTDTSFAKKFLKDYDASVTQIKFIDHKKYPLFLEMEIYDNKVSFMTFSKNRLIGVIIENKEIYKTQQSIFNALWDNI